MTLIRNFAENIQSDGDLIITGDLQVDGTTTTVNSTVVDIADKNITLGVGAATNAQNDGAGISILLPDASPDEFATILYTNSSDSWSFNKDVGIGTTAPSELLEVRKDSANAIIKVQTGGGYDARLILDAPAADGAQSQIFFDASGTTAGSIQYTHNSGGTNFMTFHTGGSNVERMRIGSNGNLELGYGGAVRQQADSQAFSIITPATGGGQGIAFKRLDSNNDQGLGEISWSNNTQDGQANIRVKTAGAVNSTDMHFDVNNAGTLVTAISIDGSAGGNVGIGTTNPGARLQVQTAHTSTDVTAANLNSTLNVANSGAGNGVYNAIKFAANQQDMYIMSFNNNQQADRRLGFFLGSVAGDAATDERLSITGNGNVGIGTPSPGYALDVKSAAEDTARFSNSAGVDTLVRIIAGDYNTELDARLFIGENDNAGMTLEYDGVANIGYIGMNDGVEPTGAFSKRIQFPRTTTHTSFMAGNVGIGTASPRATLDVRGGHSSTVNEAISFGRTDDDFRYNSIYSYNTSSTNSYLSFRIHDGGSSVAQTETMVIGPGKVGIGTTSPDSKLDVEADEDTWIARIYNTGSDANAQGLLVRSDATAAHDAPVMGVYADGGYKMLVKSTGNVGIGTTSPANKLSVNGVITSGNFTAASISGTPGDANTAEVGPGYINLARDDTADAAQILFGKNGAVHSYLETRTNGLGFVTNVGDFAFEGGDVGIGTTAPAVPLHVYNATQGRVAIENASRRFDLSVDADGLGFRDQTAAVTRMVVTTAGNVGIGTTDQIGEKLTVNGSVQVLGNNDPNYSAKFISAYDSAHGLRITTRLNDATESEVLGVFADTGGASPRLVLNPTNGWNLGIGTTTPATALDVTGTITQNTVSRQAITFSIPANVARKVKLTIANYDAFKVTLSAQRSNAGNSMVWWEGYINNNDNVGYANVISSQASGGSISYTFTNNNNGIFEWDFNSSASIGGGTVIIESAGLNLNANLATYSNV